MADGKSRSRGTRRSAGNESQPPADGDASRSRSRSAGSGDSSQGSTGSTPANPLGLDPGAFTPPEEPPPVATAGDADDDYEPAPPELLEWTPERAAAIVRAGGFVLHSADPLASEPEGTELWRATSADVESIAPPLARILNRYAPARRLAGVSDEAELMFALGAYTKRNLTTRGRALAAKRARDETEAPPAPGTWPAPEPGGEPS